MFAFVCYGFASSLNVLVKTSKHMFFKPLIVLARVCSAGLVRGCDARWQSHSLAVAMLSGHDKAYRMPLRGLVKALRGPSKRCARFVRDLSKAFESPLTYLSCLHFFVVAFQGLQNALYWPLNASSVPLSCLRLFAIAALQYAAAD